MIHRLAHPHTPPRVERLEQVKLITLLPICADIGAYKVCLLQLADIPSLLSDNLVSVEISPLFRPRTQRTDEPNEEENRPLLECSTCNLHTISALLGSTPSTRPTGCRAGAVFLYGSHECRSVKRREVKRNEINKSSGIVTVLAAAAD